MGKRILIPGLIALLLAAGVTAWLVLDPPWQGKGSGAPVLPALSNVEGGVSGGTPESRAHRPLDGTQGRQDADATSVQPGSRAGSEGVAVGTNSQPSGGNSRPGQPGGTSSTRPSSESAGKPAHSKEPPAPSVPAPTPPSRIIDATRPPNQTLGNARPVSRAIKTPPAKKLEDVSERLKQDRHGLYAQYYAFQSEPLAELAKADAKPLAQREANLMRIDNLVYFPNNEAFADLPFSLANFAATWDGYLVIPEQGEYWLFLGADNAARVDLDGETVLLNDVQSRYIEVSTVLELAPGLHPLHIEFAQGMLANEDSWRCAASFMWVPKGKQKPVAVPPEMLMVPDWMWSDDAPIIAKLETYEGGIGDEVAIYGQALCEGLVKGPGYKSSNDEGHPPEVYFNGQRAKVFAMRREELRVRIPIGASTGKLLVVRSLYTKPSGVMPQLYRIPSNGVDFKVTTQFGLMAQWYNLENNPSESFVEQGSREPDVAGIESAPFVTSRNELNLAFKGEPLALHMEGYVGVPEISAKHVLRVYFSGTARATLASETKDFSAATQDGWGCFRLDFQVPAGPEQKISISIDWLCIGQEAVLLTYLIEADELDKVDKEVTALRANWFFPPVAPPKPPRIASVIPMTIAGDEPPTPPFAATPGLVSVREGQQFKCNVEIFGDEDVRAAPVTLSVDGHVIECGSGTLIDDSANKRWFRQFVGVLPPGCGEGKLTAKLGLSTSEPFYIEVANKGLIAYLYDLPNPSGYAQFPNILPLTCHTIRKEREINFGTADSFNLPFVAETFAIEWYGAIIIEHDGWYTFTSRTDDGCRVWLNGIEIIDDDNLHAPQEKSSERIKLAPGVYPFRMQFFENNMHEECLLFVAAVDLQEKELLARQVVPKRMFTWEVHDMLPDKVATGKKADGSD